jgi:hypothetical protein
MEKKEKLLELKNKIEEVLKVTPYDLLEFNNREDEQSYIDKKTKEFDIYKNLIELEDSDGIIVITEDKTYAINPVFVHDDSLYPSFLSYPTLSTSISSSLTKVTLELFTQRGASTSCCR